MKDLTVRHMLKGQMAIDKEIGRSEQEILEDV